MAEALTKKKAPAPVPIVEEKTDFEMRIELLMIWLSKYGRVILHGVLVAVIIYSGFQLWKHYQASQVTKANDLLSAGQRAFSRALSETAWGSTERSEAMAKAREEARKVVEGFAGKPIARTALLLEADAYFFAGDVPGTYNNTGEAIRLYEQFLQQAQTPAEKALGQLALGYAYENRLFLADDQSFLQPALQAFEEVRAMNIEDAGYLKYEATNALARLNSAGGRNAEAIALYMETYKARKQFLPKRAELAPNASQAEAALNELRVRAGAFTVASNARTQLVRLGEDMEAYDRAEREAERAAAPAPAETAPAAAP